MKGVPELFTEKSISGRSSCLSLAPKALRRCMLKRCGHFLQWNLNLDAFRLERIFAVSAFGKGWPQAPFNTSVATSRILRVQDVSLLSLKFPTLTWQRSSRKVVRRKNLRYFLEELKIFLGDSGVSWHYCQLSWLGTVPIFDVIVGVGNVETDEKIDWYGQACSSGAYISSYFE